MGKCRKFQQVAGKGRTGDARQEIEARYAAEAAGQTSQGVAPAQPSGQPGAASKYGSGEIVIRNADGSESRGILTGNTDAEGRHEYHIEGDIDQLHYATEAELDAMVSSYTPEAPAVRGYAVEDEVSVIGDDGGVATGNVVETGADGVTVEFDRAVGGQRVVRVPAEQLAEMEAAVQGESAALPPVEVRDRNGEAVAVGDRVGYEQPDGTYIPGTVTAVNEDGSLNVHYDDGRDVALSPEFDMPNVSKGEYGNSTQPTTERPQQQPQTALQRIPRNEKGEPVFEKAETPELAWDALVEFSEGDAAVAKEIADVMVEERRKAFEKAQKLKPKGKTPAEILASRKANAAELDKAKTEYEHWQRMAGVEAARAQQEAEAASVQAEAQEGVAEPTQPEAATPGETVAEGAVAPSEAEQTPGEPASEDTGEQAGTNRIILSDELDQNGHQFVVSNNGTTDFGHINKETGLQEAPIKLSEGIITNHDTNAGYGLVHIEARHGEQIRNAGYKSVVDFVQDVANNFDHIREGAQRHGEQTYLLQLSDKHNNTLIVELSRDGSYWNVNTAGIFNKSYASGNKIVYDRQATVNQSAETGEGAPTVEQSDTQTEASPMPSTSDSKDNVSSGELQEPGGENAGNSGGLQENGGQAMLGEQIEAAEAETDTAPTEAQKKAGNYKKGHVRIGSFDVTIENPKGSVRSGVDANGRKWETKMNNTYGYFRGTEGVDGDHIDVFISDSPDSWDGRRVFVVDQYNEDGTFDEHKVMFGFNSQEEAEAAYLSNYDKDWAKNRRIVTTSVGMEDFEKWVASSHRKTKAFAEYKSVKGSPAQKHTEPGAERATEEQRALGEAVVAMMQEAGIEVVTDAAEMERALGEFLDPEDRADLEMMDKAENRKSHSTHENQVQASATTHASGTSSANIDINNSNKASIKTKLIELSDDLTKGKMSAEDFLRRVQNAFFGSKSINSGYAFNQVGKTNYCLRVSNHSVKARNFANTKKPHINDNTSVVVKLTGGNFRPDGRVSLVELEYKPENLTAEKMQGIVKGIQDWIDTGNYTDTAFDDKKVSPRPSPLQAMTVWHGSPHSFEAFDHSFMGTGEGAQAYGWGTYVTEVNGIARSYAEKLSGKGNDYQEFEDWYDTNYRFDDYIDSDISTREHFGISSPVFFEDRYTVGDAEESELAKEAAAYYKEDIDLDNEEETEDIIDRLFDDMSEYQKEVELDLKEKRRLEYDRIKLSAGNLYEVEIPDDNGKNYLHWEKPSSEAAVTKEAVLEQAASESVEDKDGTEAEMLAGLKKSLDEARTGEDMYKAVAASIGDRRASGLFASLGYTGISFPAQYQSGGRTDNARNYVVFDEKDLKITGHTQFLRTAEGEVYGFVKDGKVYIDSALMNPNTPVHEYTHLWDKALQKANPELWARGKELMRQLPLWQEVADDPAYADISHDEDLVASEVHSRLSGAEGARLLEEQAARAKDKGVFEHAKAVSLKERVRQWLNDALSWVRDAFGKWSGKDLEGLTLDEFAKMPVRDLAAGVNPNALHTAETGGAVQMMKTGGKGAAKEEDGALFRDSEGLFEEYPTWLSGQTTSTGQHTTQITSTQSTYKKIGEHFAEKSKKPSEVSILDASSGLGVGTQALRDMGFSVEDVEPYPSEKRDSPTYLRYEDVNKKYDVVISNAVLNVIPDDWRADVLKNMADKLKVGGKLIINVRDAASIQNQKQKIELDSPSEILVTDKKGNIRAYQKGFTVQELLDYVQSQLGEGYTVERANKGNSGLSGMTAVVVTRNDATPLSFREPGEEQELLSGDKKTKTAKKREVVKGFGGIWIDNAHEYAKFAKAVSTFPFEQNGEGVVYTDNHFYAYYRNIDGEPIPYVDVYLNEEESQNLVDYIKNKLDGNVRERVKRGFSRYNLRLGSDQGEDNGNDGNNNSLSRSGGVDALARERIFRKGRYFDSPVRYVKSERADSSLYRNRERGGDLNSDPAAIREQAEVLARKLNTPVRFVDNTDEITHDNTSRQKRMRRAKGWFDPKTGRITVVVGNHRSAADIQATLLHEAVAHYGLRKLFGEHFDAFLDNVFANASAEVRRGIMAYAARHNTGFRVATEEYLASLAETTDFERAEKSGWWQRIKDFFTDMLRKAGIDLGTELTDNELRYILWRSYRNLQEPPARQGILGQAADIAKQSELGVGNYAGRKQEATVAAGRGTDSGEHFRMGDASDTFKARQQRAVENKGTVMPGLNSAEVKIVDVPRHQYKGHDAITQAKEAAINRYSESGKGKNRELKPQHYSNNSVEFDYVISPKSISEAANHAVDSDNIGVHIAVMDRLHEVINNSIEIEEHPDVKKVNGERKWENGFNSNILMHRFAGAINIDGETYRVKTTMKEYENEKRPNGHYTYEVTKIELLDSTDGESVVLSTSYQSNSDGRSNVSDVFVSGSKLLQNLEKSYDEGKKILEESTALSFKISYLIPK